MNIVVIFFQKEREKARKGNRKKMKMAYDNIRTLSPFICLYRVQDDCKPL